MLLLFVPALCGARYAGKPHGVFGFLFSSDAQGLPLNLEIGRDSELSLLNLSVAKAYLDLVGLRDCRFEIQNF